MNNMLGGEPQSKRYKVMENIGLSNDEITHLLSEEEDIFEELCNKSACSRADPPTGDLEGHYGFFEPASMPPIVPSSSHTVLFKLPVVCGKVPEPYVGLNKDCWDSQHVRMPFSNHSLYPVDTASGKILKPRWELVKEALSKKITSSKELENAILSYNTRYRQKWDFSALHTFFIEGCIPGKGNVCRNQIFTFACSILNDVARRNKTDDTSSNNSERKHSHLARKYQDALGIYFPKEELDPSESEYFFDNILPSMVHLALSLPHLIQCPIPLLRRKKPASISLSQKQVASLLANAFFCTFPRRNTAREPSEYSSFPDINFNRLYQAHKWKPKARIGFEKLKCLIHYFRRVCSKDPDGVLTFTRHFCAESTLPKWSESAEHLPRLRVCSKGRIEDEGAGMLQVDFANKFVGGGVLGSGCVQEEIQFLICPELIVSRLFTEALDKTEALVVSGCERFSVYKGYSETFEWVGDYNGDKLAPNGPDSPRDAYGRRLTSIVAIDALNFSTPSRQYSQEALLREINKAYVGFHSPDEILGLPAVATGNWGCGVFHGDAHLKALLQLMAAAKSRRDLMYFTFGNDKLRDDIYSIHKFLYTNKIPIGELWQHLCQYYEHCYQNGSFTTNLYSYLYSVLEEPASRNESKPQHSSADINAVSENKSFLETEIQTKSLDRSNGIVKENEPDEAVNAEETGMEEENSDKMEAVDRSPDLFKEDEDMTLENDNSMLKSLKMVGENG